MTDERQTPNGRWTVDGRFMTVYQVGEDAGVRRGPRQPAGTAVARPAGRPTGDPLPGKAPQQAGKPGRKRARGVTAGRVVAAGAGIAAMVGLVAQMQVAGASTAGVAPQAPVPAGPNPSTALLRWEQGVHQGPATDPQRYAAVDARKPIVLTPHTIVNTVGGGSSSGGYSGGYAASAPSYSAPAAAPVASSGGSAPH
jgi:hypothetical protein